MKKNYFNKKKSINKDSTKKKKVFRNDQESYFVIHRSIDCVILLWLDGLRPPITVLDQQNSRMHQFLGDVLAFHGIVHSNFLILFFVQKVTILFETVFKFRGLIWTLFSLID